MTTSSELNTFNLDITDIAEEAYERCGLELRTSYDLTTARRSLNLLLTEWNNHQVNIWKLVQNTESMTASTSSYALDSTVLDVLDGVLRLTDGITDIPIERISMEEYLNRTDKTAEGRPSQYSVLRGRDAITLYLYNTPDDTYSFVYWAMQYIQDVGAFTNNADVPTRFLPALISGLAWKLAEKNPAKAGKDPQSGQYIELEGVSSALRTELKQTYLEAFQLARNEDRDRTSFRVRPRVARI